MNRLNVHHLTMEFTKQTLEIIRRLYDGPIVAGDFGEPHQNGACDHEGQCVLLAVWAQLGDHMRELLGGISLADIAAIAQGGAPWPGTADSAASI